MKKTLCIMAVVLSIVSMCIFGCSGCKAEKINIIHTDNVVTNIVPAKAFNDENYVWEGWQFSTNKVDKLD